MPLTIANVTNNSVIASDNTVTGDGIFDDLMETVNRHLEAQHNLNRITSVDYANVYLGALQTTLQQAVGYVLGQEKTNADVSLTTAQETLAAAQTALITQQVLTEIQHTIKVTKDVIVSTNQGTLLANQALSEVANELLIDANKLLVDNKAATELAQELQIDAQTALLGVQATSIVDKTAAEVSILGQKEITEFAQTGQTTKTPATSTSIMGAQSNLSIQQAKGFKWNADQKYLKTILDAWSINVSTAGVAATGVTAINEVGTNNLNDRIDAAEPTG